MCRFIFTLSLILCMCYVSTALKCVGCDPESCKKPVGCKGDIVKDVCNCCDTCAKTLGEVCGGPFDIFGKCGSQFECLKEVTKGLDIRNARGKCQPICGPVCKIYCEKGNVLDGNGCPTCSCNE